MPKGDSDLARGLRMFGKLALKTSAVLLLVSIGIGAAAAQNYDGSGLLKYGSFAQGAFLDASQTQPSAASASPSGFTGGVSLGYDLTVQGRWLIGLEVDGSYGDARETAGSTDYGFDYLATVRGRFGVHLRPDWLLYGTAGVGFLGIEAQLNNVGLKAAETLTGFVGGVGTEVDWHHVILFGEYLYGNFGDTSFDVGGIAHKVEFDTHLARLGLKFKVGHDYAHDYDHPDHYKRQDGLK